MSQPLSDDKYEWVKNDDCRNAFAALQHKTFIDLWYDQNEH